MFPRVTVASMSGSAGMAGAVGGMLFVLYVGQVSERIGTYAPVSFVASGAYLAGFLWMHVPSSWLAPTR